MIKQGLLGNVDAVGNRDQTLDLRIGNVSEWAHFEIHVCVRRFNVSSLRLLKTFFKQRHVKGIRH